MLMSVYQINIRSTYIRRAAEDQSVTATDIPSAGHYVFQERQQWSRVNGNDHCYFNSGKLCNIVVTNYCSYIAKLLVFKIY